MPIACADRVVRATRWSVAPTDPRLSGGATTSRVNDTADSLPKASGSWSIVFSNSTRFWHLTRSTTPASRPLRDCSRSSWRTHRGNPVYVEAPRPTLRIPSIVLWHRTGSVDLSSTRNGYPSLTAPAEASDPRLVGALSVVADRRSSRQPRSLRAVGVLSGKVALSSVLSARLRRFSDFSLAPFHGSAAFAKALRILPGDS